MMGVLSMINLAIALATATMMGHIMTAADRAEVTRTRVALEAMAESAARVQSYLDRGHGPAAGGPVATDDVIAQGFLPPGWQTRTPWGDPIEVTAVPGDHNVRFAELSFAVPARDMTAVSSVINQIDLGGGSVSLQAVDGAARFAPGGGGPGLGMRVRLLGRESAGLYQGNLYGKW